MVGDLGLHFYILVWRCSITTISLSKKQHLIVFGCSFSSTLMPRCVNCIYLSGKFRSWKFLCHFEHWFGRYCLRNTNISLKFNC